MRKDPSITDSDKYKVVFENDRVRVLEYKDKPGDKTTPHHHPDSLMYFLSSFTRRITSNGESVVVDGKEGTTAWLKEQEHAGENIGDTDTHVLLVELKEPNSSAQDRSALGPERAFYSRV